MDEQKPAIQVNEGAGNFFERFFTEPPEQVPAVHNQVENNGKDKTHYNDQGCQPGIDRLPDPENQYGEEKTDIANKSRAVKHSEQSHGSKIQISA